MSEHAERLHRTAGLIALTVGVGTATSPRTFVRPFGVPAQEITAAGAWGWRMFGIRTALIGGLIVAGDTRARAAMIPVQIADQVTFVLAGRGDGGVPTRAVRMAQAVSGALVVLSGLAYLRD
ncbi:hypothetical protein [Paraconexibacter sp.]|uniref:hypothetical protein n=1 Tax=Paraconexibacter sp. TaxID=2949640 RepID=UPI00356A188C